MKISLRMQVMPWRVDAVHYRQHLHSAPVVALRGLFEKFLISIERHRFNGSRQNVFFKTISSIVGLRLSVLIGLRARPTSFRCPRLDAVHPHRVIAVVVLPWLPRLPLRPHTSTVLPTRSCQWSCTRKRAQPTPARSTLAESQCLPTAS
jgi:hypothetical protein